MESIFFVGLFAIINFTLAWAGDPEITTFLKHLSVMPHCDAVNAVDNLKVIYDNDVIVNKGKELTPTQAKNQPVLVDWNADENLFYTLMMIHTERTPIVESDLETRESHHWLVVNIPGKNINSGDIISEYLSCGPPKGTGLHLYSFLLYKQHSKLKFDEKFINKYSLEERLNFAVAEFADKYDLGCPLAANYFEAQYDDYVPIVHAQIGY